MPEAGAVAPAAALRPMDGYGRGPASGLDEVAPTASLHAALLAQVRTLAAFIEGTRQEIAAVGAGDIVGLHLPTAADELDAIVLHTAEATGLILDECETLETLFGAGPFHTAVSETTTRIYEACSFQDITGQRVAKVVHTLKAIETKVSDMLRVFGCEASAELVPPSQSMLLNGPQRSEHAMRQREVDALLASFE